MQSNTVLFDLVFIMKFYYQILWKSVSRIWLFSLNLKYHVKKCCNVVQIVQASTFWIHISGNSFSAPCHILLTSHPLTLTIFYILTSRLLFSVSILLGILWLSIIGKNYICKIYWIQDVFTWSSLVMCTKDSDNRHFY